MEKRPRGEKTEKKWKSHALAQQPVNMVFRRARAARAHVGRDTTLWLCSPKSTQAASTRFPAEAQPPIWIFAPELNGLLGCVKEFLSSPCFSPERKRRSLSRGQTR